MKIAIAQLNPIVGDIEGNAKTILEAAQTAFNQGARLLLTPELSLCGYPPRDLLLNPSFVKSMSIELEKLAQQIPPELAVLVGTVDLNPNAASRGEKPLYNSIAFLEQNQIQQIFHKRLLPTYDVFDEDRYFESGRESHAFKIFPSPQASNFVKVGVTICEDLWNDEEFWGKRNYEASPIEDLAQLEVDFVVNLSASPYSVNKQKLRESMLLHSVTKYKVPIIYNNQVGGNDDLIFDGNSFAYNRQGEICCRAKSFETDLILLDFSEEKQDFLPATIHPLPKTQEEEIFSALVLGLKDYAYKCGFTKVVLGLSGGIDSSLVATIAVKAMGKDNVLGVLMPSPYSSEHSITDAEALVKNLEIKSYQLPIAPAMKVYDQILDPLFAGTQSGIAEENIQSRIRGNLLMAIANKFGYLLLSTGNKSEMAVGYCTLYGDMNGGLAVISDVPKTEVFSICHWLNRHEEIIPHHVLIKPPSAELKPGQLDQDSLPPYEILDDILARMIHHHQSISEIVNTGHDLDTVKKVMKMVMRAEFKRKQAPPGLKITDRAFGTGWRMPIASRWL
ncbi:NAD+ synthetase [Gloeothece citriformis PCC 7424]|uniref:Glutamine-dependent NAD(+) synthetase n=1 Tax=Gloeothece citriformis (strain PCC 7424) TaxID=65393 RepID=B7KAT6_GLOC7|nr:NAD+ synthase [Gloeothece citriformis]ACK68758.1 NAD+ synthetase [Gloeothece citriformis PCC 7424]